MATTTNYGWTTPDNTALVKDGASAIRTLGSSVDTTVFANANAAVQKSSITAKGDILIGTGAGTFTAQTVGANGTVLTANSAQADGVEWATISAGGLTLLSTTALSGTSTTVSSISTSYKNLQIFLSAVTPNATAVLTLRLNGISSSSYNYTGITTNANPSVWTAVALGTSFSFGTNMGSSNPGSYTVQIPNYAFGSNVRSVQINGGSTNSDAVTNTFGFLQNQTSAISSITIGTVAGTATLSGSILIYGVN